MKVFVLNIFIEPSEFHAWFLVQSLIKSLIYFMDYSIWAMEYFESKILKQFLRTLEKMEIILKYIWEFQWFFVSHPANMLVRPKDTEERASISAFEMLSVWLQMDVKYLFSKVILVFFASLGFRKKAEFHPVPLSLESEAPWEIRATAHARWAGKQIEMLSVTNKIFFFQKLLLWTFLSPSYTISFDTRMSPLRKQLGALQSEEISNCSVTKKTVVWEVALRHDEAVPVA